MMEQRILRTLYRTDDTEQLTLGRSRSLVPIYRLTTISDDTESASNGQPTEYASVSVKHCIESLCEASPDLFKDETRDFSVYHLDPLESVGSAGGSTSSHTPAGVPVGLGLMSDLKSADRNLLLTGTLTKLRTGLEALEVVFTIREIRRPNRVNLKSHSSSTSSSQPGPSTHHHNPNIAAAITRRRNEQEAQGRRTMRGTNDKRHLNRQLGSAAARCGVAESLLAGASNYHTAGKKSSSEEPPSYSSTPPEMAVYPSPPASQPQASSSSQLTPEPPTQPSSSSTVPDTATLLAVLGLIDDASATTNLEGNTQFQEALKGLLAQVLNAAPPAKPPGEDDDVVPLDKENVNPDAFRKRARSLEATKSLESAAPSPQPAPTPEAPDRSNQGLGLGGRSNTLPLVKEKHRAVSSSSENRSGGSRKGKERAKDTIYSSFSGSSSTVPWSSPPRPLNGGCNYGGIGSSRGTPIVIPDSPLTPKAVRVPASSPIRGNKSKQKQKPYVVPEWARTTTATQPKFSEEFQRAQEEDQKRQVEERKTRRAQWPSMKSRSTTSLPTTTGTASIPDTGSTTDERPCTPPPLPVFAAGLSSHSIFALPVCAASSSPFLCPKTPPRKRPRSPSQSPLNRSGGLFTPTPKHTSFAEAFHSPLYSPSHRARKMIRSDPGPLDTAVDPHGTEDDDALAQELGSALDELGTSSTSLPVVSSDAETESSANDDVDISSDNEGDGEDTYPRKQFWPGLPPSSPPPSSPMLQDHLALPPADTPIEEDENDSRLPVVSSDVEDILSPSDDRTPMNSDTPDAGLDNLEGQGIELPPTTSAPESDANLFALFTNLGNTSSDPLEYDWNLPGDMAATTNLEDLDFTQFWESVKPLIDDQQQQPACSSGDVQMNNGAPTVDSNEGSGFLQLLEGSAGTALDSSKFADDLRTLYSGCVM